MDGIHSVAIVVEDGQPPGQEPVTTKACRQVQHAQHPHVVAPWAS